MLKYIPYTQQAAPAGKYSLAGAAWANKTIRGSIMTVIIGKILSIFFITGVGFTANKKGILPNQANKYLVDLLMLITCPCMIIVSILDNELTSETASVTFHMLCYSILFFVGAYIISYLFCIRILKIKKEEGAGVYMACMTTINNGFMGFPITYALFGNEILFLMVLFQSVLVTYIYSVGIMQVNYGTQKKGNLTATLKSIANPCTIAAAAGIFLLLTGIQIPQVLYDTLDQLGSATVPVSMLVVGLQLGNSDIINCLKNKILVITSVFKMIFWPLLTFLAVNWLPLSSDIKIALVFGAAFPAAVAVVPIASMEGKDAVLAAESVAFTTLLSIATLPLTALLLINYYGVL